MAAVAYDEHRAGVLPSLGEVIEQIGVGPAQLRAVLLGGGVWLADGAELLLIGTVTRAVSEEWQLHAWQRGFVVSVVFVGILLGNSICGPLGDQSGRRLPILLSYAGIAVFSALSAAVPNFAMLCCVRLLVGASFGIGQPAVNALCCEITPTHWRVVIMSFTSSLFVVGEVYSALLIWWDDPQMQALHWRQLLLLGAIPSVIFGVLALLFLHQSPSFLAVTGDADGARAVLESMRHDNRAWQVSVTFQPPPSPPTQRSFLEPIGILFSNKMLYSTLVIIYSCFTLNVLYYGCLYAFPQVITEVDLGVTPAMGLLFGALWELPGLVAAVILCAYFPRKPVIMGYLFFSSLSLVAFGYGLANAGGGFVTEALTHTGYVGIKAVVTVGFIAVYQYSTEIYPTIARTTGTAACVAGGRVGGIVAPVFFEWMVEWTGRASVFFFSIAGLCVLNILLVFFLPFETFGKALEDHIAEAAPLKADLEKSDGKASI